MIGSHQIGTSMCHLQISITLVLFDHITKPENQCAIIDHSADFWLWSHFEGNRQTKNAQKIKKCQKKLTQSWERAKYDMCAQTIPYFHFLTSLSVFHNYIDQ